MYDLNDSGFDAAGGSTVIFNGGVAGLVNDVKMSVYKKKPDDKENAPDYKITFTDDNGGECSTSYWYVTKDTQYSTVEEQVKKQGKSMKHIIHAVYGADHQIGFKANNPKELLDQAMKYIKDGLASAGKFRVFATYGTVNAPKQYIQPRSWVPFVESMSVDVSQTRLKLAVTIDAMDRIVKDEVEVATAKADELLEGDDW
tara:strand:- start:3520 stop:4119 length:600 start_codon:yes stop_codon:yes gene_type:complete